RARGGHRGRGRDGGRAAVGPRPLRRRTNRHRCPPRLRYPLPVTPAASAVRSGMTGRAWMAAQESAGEEWFRLASGCDRIVSGTRPRSLRDRITELAESEVDDVDLDGRPDAYGDGPVEVLERRVAGLLGKPAAAFFPSGTMAQQVALRTWAQRTGNP